MVGTGSYSGSGTKMNAALFPYWARCRSTQLEHTLSFPPTNHFQNGGLLVSSVVCQYLSQLNRSAYSRKHSGKFFSENRSVIAGSTRFACPMNFADERTYSSSFQWTAICASFVSAERSMAIVPASPRLHLLFAGWPLRQPVGQQCMRDVCPPSIASARISDRSFSEHEERCGISIPGSS